MKAWELPEWGTLAAELTRNGYVELLLIELTCPSHGDWRLGVLTDSEARIICPRCCAPCSFAVLGRGLSRHRILEPYCVSPSLPAAAKLDQRNVAVGVHSVARAGRRRNPGFLRRMQRELAPLQASIRS
jgi:hypothetical protein